MLSTLFGSQTARSSFLCFCLSLYSAACGEIQRHLGRINGVIAVLSPNLQLHLHNTQAGTSKDFYPRPPRGGRHGGGEDGLQIYYFYPRPPRGGRQVYSSVSTAKDNFYPRPPRGGRRVRPGQRAPLRAISIHALREEGDRLSREKHPTERQFLSTPSARRATLWGEHPP